MDEKEKIIKKTAELIFEDIKQVIKPVGLWAKLLFAGVICGASSILLFMIRKRMSGWFKLEVFGDKHREKGVLDILTFAVGVLLLFHIFVNTIMAGVLGVEPFLYPIGIKFLIMTNLIGWIGGGFYYLLNKKSQAEILLLKKKPEEKIKIEGKEKETPKIIGRVNT